VTIKTADDLTGASIRLGAPAEGHIVIAPDLRSAARAAGQVNAPLGAGAIVAPVGQSIAMLPIPAGVKRVEIILPGIGDDLDILAGTAELALRATMRDVQPVANSSDRAKGW
jgi:hypothetical protein